MGRWWGALGGGLMAIQMIAIGYLLAQLQLGLDHRAHDRCACEVVDKLCR